MSIIRALVVVLLLSLESQSASGALFAPIPEDESPQPAMDTVITLTIHGEDTTRSYEIRPRIDFQQSQRDIHEAKSSLGVIAFMLSVLTLITVGTLVYGISQSE